MAGFLDSTVKDIDQRLHDLKEEVARLEAARSALIGLQDRGGGARGSRRSATSSRRADRRHSPRRGRRGSGSRANQALELVRGQPGITIPEIAESMSIEPNYLYRVMPKLVAEGQVRREGQGWHPSS